ncbi:MAG: Mrp/NBP35 family ATP-binding protein [Planctomycetota bacterium]
MLNPFKKTDGAATVTEAQVLQALRAVEDPDLHRDIVSLGFVKNLRIDGGAVAFDIELTTPACPVKDQLQAAARARVAALPGVTQVVVDMKAMVRAPEAPAGQVLQSVKHTIAVGSGKGGVGKSTVAVNLSLALSAAGARVGLLDADIYGPSIPTMFAIGGRPRVTPEQKILPLEKSGLKLMSMGFVAGEDTPVIMRGPMVANLMKQFLSFVEWGELDYLVIDLPPGTGDVQLTLTQTVALTGAVIATTPQEVSLIDARKALKMFEKVSVPVLGIVENMSYFECGHCHQRTNIFRTGGGQRTAQQLGVPFLGGVPIDPGLVEASDLGQPYFLEHPESPAAVAFRQIAGQVAAQLSILAMREHAGPQNLTLEWK